MTENSPIQPLRQIGAQELSRRIAPSKQSAEGPGFAELLRNSIQEVNQLQKAADAAIQDLSTGKSESVSEVLTAVEKADLAFRALMQIRNKLLDAYDEINRLRI